MRGILNYSPRDEVCRIGYGIWANADVPVFNKLDSLGTWSIRTQYSGTKVLQAERFDQYALRRLCPFEERSTNKSFSTYRAHTFSHFESMHDYSESSPTKRGYSEFIFNLGKLGGGIEDPYVVEFRQ